MCRKDILVFLSEKFGLSYEDIDIAFHELYLKYKDNCCQDLVEEALEMYTKEEYCACRVFFEFLFTGSDE